MGLETGNYIDNLDRDWPLSSDNVSEGDNHLQLIKRALQYTFPLGTDTAATSDVGPDQAVQVLIAKSSAPTIDTSASGHAARAMGMIWLDTSANLLKIRNQANDAWITLAIDPETSNSVDVNAGTIDGAVIGGATPAAITGTTLTGNTSLALATGATVTGVDNGSLGTSATLLATQGAIKTYVDAQVTAQDLDLISDSGTIDIDLDSDSLTVTGGEGIDTSATGTTLTITGEEASTSNKGVASFSSDNFSVSSGAVTIKDQGVANAELAYMAANTVKVRDANSLGAPSDLALATTEIMIGDGTGFTAAALSGDATMTNAGAVSVVKIQGQDVSATAATNDQYLKYSSTSSEWQKVDVLSPDRLTTKGDLLVYNTVDSETRLAVGTNDYSLLADSSATNGVSWKQVPTAGIADDAVTAAKLDNTGVTANTYAYPSAIVVDAQGRLTSATAGTAGATAGFAVAMAIAL
jgi:hypothetical protein